MYRIIFPCLLLFACLISAAQTKYEVGIEGKIVSCKYRISDACNQLATVPCVSGAAGINFRVNTGKSLFYEGALMFTEYGEGLGFNKAPATGYTNSDAALLLALRAGAYLRLSGKFSLTPVVGLVPGVVVDNTDGRYSSTTQFATDTLRYEYTSRQLHRKFLILAQGGIGLDHKPGKRIRIAFMPAYYLGLRRNKIFDVNYRVNNGPVRPETTYGKGRFIPYGLSVGYLFEQQPVTIC